MQARKLQERAEVGAKREDSRTKVDRRAWEVGACGGCGNGPAGCGCVPTGPVPPVIYTPPPDGTPRAPRYPTPDILWPKSMRDIDGNPQTAYDWYAAQMAANGDYGCVPYVDAVRDCIMMLPVSSGTPVSVGAGASTLLTIGPTRGWLDSFYFDIVALNPATGLSVDPASFRITPPRVSDCPQPADTTPQRGTFNAAIDGCCCGRPLRAIIGRSIDNEAMTLTFTNDGIATVSVQAIVRGFPHARSLCL